MKKRERGYYGIGAYCMKNDINYGTLFRSAQGFNADFIFLIGKRFKRQSSDTSKAYRHLPLYEYATSDEFFTHIPYRCQIVGIEIATISTNIYDFNHPTQAIYLLGAEDHGLPDTVLNRCQHIIEIPSIQCLNVSTIGSIVMYDRLQKGNQHH